MTDLDNKMVEFFLMGTKRAAERQLKESVNLMIKESVNLKIKESVLIIMIIIVKEPVLNNMMIKEKALLDIWMIKEKVLLDKWRGINLKLIASIR